MKQVSQWHRWQGIKLPDEINKSIDLTDNALLFYTEHTVGYSESVREPLSQPTMEQRALKESYAWEANRRTASIGEEAMGLLQSKFTRESQPSLIVFNTLNWKRSGLATVYIDHQIVPRGKIAGIFDKDGKQACSAGNPEPFRCNTMGSVAERYSGFRL